MKKTIFLIGILLIITILVIIVMFSSQRSKPTYTIGVLTPTPISTSISTNEYTKIISTDPSNKKPNVPVNQVITILLNKNISKKDISVTITPNTPHELNVANTQVFINFLSDLSPRTVYMYTISYKNIQLGIYTFTTTDTQSKETNDNATQINTIWSRANKPDLFLYNQIPYTNTSFSVQGDMTTTAPYHFYFTVSLTGTNTNQDKVEFINWLTSLGLTNDQIQNLDIRYQ